VRLRIGASRLERGWAADASPLFDSCVEAAEQIEEPDTLAFALYWRSSCAAHLADFKRARTDADRGIHVARRAGSRLAELANLRCLNVSLLRLGEVNRAIEAGESALAIATDLGVAPYVLAALHNVACTYTLTGQHARAVSLCLKRIELSRELGDVRGEALSLGVLADATTDRVSTSWLCRACCGRCSLSAAHGADRHHGLCLMKLGHAYEAMGSFPEAIIHYLEESLPIFRQLQLPHKAEQVQDALDRCHKAAEKKAQASSIRPRSGADAHR
jgi:tetratricopeptide (TPR) repeat protein